MLEDGMQHVNSDLAQIFMAQAQRAANFMLFACGLNFCQFRHFCLLLA